MARQKQVAPLQREPSDFSAGPPQSANRDRRNQANGKTLEKSSPEVNGNAQEPLVPILPTSPNEAGFTQLIICVGGIYASLCVLFPPHSPSLHPLTKLAVSPGPSSKSA